MFVIRARSKGFRVRVETLRDEDGHFHRRWTFTGGGRWESFGQGNRGREHFAVLDRPGVRDSTSIRFLKGILGKGADRLVYEIEVRRIAPGPGGGPPILRIKRVLAGNGDNGSPGFTSSFDIPLPDAPWPSQIESLPRADVDLVLPARVPLGRFAGTTEVIEFR